MMVMNVSMFYLVVIFITRDFHYLFKVLNKIDIIKLIKILAISIFLLKYKSYLNNIKRYFFHIYFN